MDESLRQPTNKEKAPFHAMAEAFGVGRNNVVWWRLIAVVAIPWAILTTGWAIYETKTKPRVETVFVLVDEETRVLHTAKARTWTFDEQAKADLARRWVWHMRTRPQSDHAAVAIRSVAAKITAKGSKAAGDAEMMIQEIDEKLGRKKDATKLALAVREGVDSAQLGHDEETGASVIGVYWQERTENAEGHVGPWEHRYINIVVQSIEPRDTAEVMANGVGLYVVDISKLGLGRPQNARVAASQ